MRFLMLYRPTQSPAKASIPDPEHMAKMGRYIEEMTREGVLLDTGGLLPSPMTMRVRRAGAELTVSQGPFPETKDFCGYAVIQTGTKEEAVAHAKRFLMVAGEGDSEILPLMERPA